MTWHDYPKILKVECAICGQMVTIAVELIAGIPRPIGGLMRVPYDPEPTVLDGCEHFHEKGENPND